jgi:hypothetical protein
MMQDSAANDLVDNAQKKYVALEWVSGKPVGRHYYPPDSFKVKYILLYYRSSV